MNDLQLFYSLLIICLLFISLLGRLLSFYKNLIKKLEYLTLKNYELDYHTFLGTIQSHIKFHSMFFRPSSYESVKFHGKPPREEFYLFKSN